MGGVILKKLIFFLLCMIMMFSTVGCGKEKEEEYFETTLSFDKNGGIKDVIVESFSQDYYSEDGLKAFFQEKISEYNSSNVGGKDVTLDSIAVEDGKAKATLIFEDSEAYSSFYNSVAFYGTISEAYDKGYITETVLKKVGASETISKVDLMKMSNAEIIIVGEVVRVDCPKKVTYVSANVEVINDKTVRVSSDSSGLAYILLK